ncbi:hypothetical protein AABD41_01625 [Staphylococcus pseudoxylosus]|uniref:hypothetical protein n=1 Tax=Staphylococcus pseudoxylosus TaxID=2282419 RepID=UPI00398AD9B9
MNRKHLVKYKEIIHNNTNHWDNYYFDTKTQAKKFMMTHSVDTLEDMGLNIDEVNNVIVGYQDNATQLLEYAGQVEHNTLGLNKFAEIKDMYFKAHCFETFLKYKWHSEKYGRQGDNELEKVYESVMQDYLKMSKENKKAWV